MNGIIIYTSKHLGNTKKIALAIADKTKYQAIDFNELPEHFDIATYDVVGFGSGIYAHSFDRKMVKFIKSLKPSIEKRKCFIFSTAGSPNASTYAQKKIEDILVASNHEIIGKWSCLGLDKFFIFKLFGGFNKGHPNQEDMSSLNQWIEHTLKIV